MTFDEFKDKGTELEMDLDMTSRKTKSLVTSSDVDDHFINLLLFQTQLKIMHWGTDSYAEHNAYGTTYGSIDEGLDTLVESYQGYVGRINLAGQYTILNFADINTDEWLSGIMEKIEELRKEITYSDVQNLLDELLASVSKFKYLLSLNK